MSFYFFPFLLLKQLFWRDGGIKLLQISNGEQTSKGMEGSEASINSVHETGPQGDQRGCYGSLW